MGIKSTYSITREVALQCLAWYRLDGSWMSNEDIELKLEDFEESHFRNYCIVDKIEDGDRHIPSVTAFTNPAY